MNKKVISTTMDSVLGLPKGKVVKSSWLVDGVEIAQVTSFKDYTKAKETDRIRTKLVNQKNIEWNRAGLLQLAPQKKELIKSLKTSLGSYPVRVPRTLQSPKN